jgi:hypothetical protein
MNKDETVQNTSPPSFVVLEQRLEAAVFFILKKTKVAIF